MNVACPFCTTSIELSRAVQQSAELFACHECLNPMLLDMHGGTVTAEPIPGAQDARLVTDEASIAGALLREVKATLDSLPILPAMSQRIVALTDDDDASIKDLGELVSQDPVVASKVIQMANSAYYRGLSEITDITSACSRLGMRTVANTAHSVAMDSVFHSEDKRFNDVMERLWRHSVAVAHLASEIASLMSMPHIETIYLMGLMHDIGKLAITNVVAHSKDERTSTLRENEQVFTELVGRFHGLVGLHIALGWDIPADLTVGIYFHHEPDSGPSENWRRLAHTVALANSIAHVSGFPSEYTRDVSLITSPSATFFSLSDVKLASLRVDLEDRMDSFISALA